MSLQLWEVLGVWVSGLATLSAVVLSLYLAYDNRRLKVKFTVRLMTALETGKKYICYRVVNCGDVPVTIKHVGLRIKKRDLVHLSLEDMLGKVVERTLLRSEDVEYTFPVEPIKEKLAGDKLGTSKKIKAFLYTSIGKGFFSRPRKDVLRELGLQI